MKDGEMDGEERRMKARAGEKVESSRVTVSRGCAINRRCRFVGEIAMRPNSTTPTRGNGPYFVRRERERGVIERD